MVGDRHYFAINERSTFLIHPLRFIVQVNVCNHTMPVLCGTFTAIGKFGGVGRGYHLCVPHLQRSAMHVARNFHLKEWQSLMLWGRHGTLNASGTTEHVYTAQYIVHSCTSKWCMYVYVCVWEQHMTQKSKNPSSWGGKVTLHYLTISLCGWFVGCGGS